VSEFSLLESGVSRGSGLRFLLIDRGVRVDREFVRYKDQGGYAQLLEELEIERQQVNKSEGVRSLIRFKSKTCGIKFEDRFHSTERTRIVASDQN
jgi:hypothetical protein